VVAGVGTTAAVELPGSPSITVVVVNNRHGWKAASWG
jgi:hypothetical protein